MLLHYYYALIGSGLVALALCLTYTDVGVSFRNLDQLTLRSLKNSDQVGDDTASLSWIYFITPYKKRLTGKADLTRLSQTLKLIPKLHWILVEDAENVSVSIEDLLQRSGLSYTHLAASSFRDKLNKGRGMIQRNEALNWLRKQPPPQSGGVVYFGDEDNTYSVTLFGYIRKVKKVGIWPVAISGGAYVEFPRTKNGKVVGWQVIYSPNRKFATDMAGFALNLSLIREHQNASFHNRCGAGDFEPCFLKQFNLSLADLEPFGLQPNPKTRLKDIVVWHTKTAEPRSRAGSRNGFDI